MQSALLCFVRSGSLPPNSPAAALLPSLGLWDLIVRHALLGEIKAPPFEHRRMLRSCLGIPEAIEGRYGALHAKRPLPLHRPLRPVSKTLQ